MSTIASPRESSINGRDRRAIPQISTPTASSRTSLDLPQNTRSTDASPSRQPSLPPKRNRAALRSYYNLPSNSKPPSSSPPSSNNSIHDFSLSDLTESPMDSPTFNAQKYITDALAREDLSGLLRVYNGVLTDIRALDAEKKALVYDNYSKLIVATETIGRMRGQMEPGDLKARRLDGEVGRVYEMASKLREEMRGNVETRERERRREAVGRVLETPGRLRRLVDEGKEEDAKEMWEPILKVLERWRERGVGGKDVLDCIEDGEAALKGEPPNEKSWVNVKKSRGEES